MEHSARRPMIAVATLTTAGALALSPITAAPPGLHPHNIAATHISSQAVQLTDAWSDLVTNSVTNVVQIAATFIGLNSSFPCPIRSSSLRSSPSWCSIR
ncbi:hypothetical protein EV580_1795 [Mycobacterium sp. BK086]|nr:hypothetical protein EV580_1795 [Mycobacterium sp. BK086]